MARRAHIAWFGLIIVLMVLVVAMLIWLAKRPPAPEQGASAGGIPVPIDLQHADLRMAVIPERDVFVQQRRHQALADYLADQLHMTVGVVTVNTYQAALDELAEGHVNVAFLGSMVGVLAHDRLGCQPVAKPVIEGDISTYRGVVFVRDDSPVRTVEELAGKSVAMVRTTTAGNLYPIDLFLEKGMMNGGQPPVFRWAGTHDVAIGEVVKGHVVAGAVKDLRLMAYEKAHPEVKLRWLATGPAVPNNALFVGPNVSASSARSLGEVLMAMDKTEQGREALAQFGAVRFEPCTMQEYDAVYRMVDRIGDLWPKVGVAGPPPRRPMSAVGDAMAR